MQQNIDRLESWAEKWQKEFNQGRTMANAVNRRASLIFLLCVWDLVSGQIRYSIPEELKHGAFVGNIIEDLHLNVLELPARKFRLISDVRKQLLEVNMENGVLFVNERMDREQLCRESSTCLLSLQIALENPLEMHRFAVEILDVNDNSPRFPKSEFSLDISELITTGARFPLESARDVDVGINTISTYQLDSNEHFGLKVQTRNDGSKIAELLLVKSLDREEQSTYKLVLTAVDGGIPQRSGTAQIIINVLDANDNAPVFDHEIYRTNVVENAPNGTLVIRINAVDIDEGINAQVKYSFTDHASQKTRELFKLNPRTGEIRIQGILDFEESNVYELEVQAVNIAPPAMAGHSKVVIGLFDVNDNAPEVEVTSVSGVIPEDAALGSVIALISVTDRDSGTNGQVQCQIESTVPFKLQKSFRNSYKLVTNDILDREMTPLYNVSILAWDRGSPSLSTRKTISLSVSDINDNAPRFTQSSYNLFLMENNAPGLSIFTITALDSDLDQNGKVFYSIPEPLKQGISPSAYVSINSDTGNIYALRSFDYEQLKHFQIKIKAQDGGYPSLSSIAIVNVIILDQNDNAPVIVSPLTWNNSEAVEIGALLTHPGYLVTRVTATDADSGQNARLSYQLVDASDPSLFSVGLLSGEIRIIRSLTGQDTNTQRLVILVKDNGQPSLSSTATIIFSVVTNVTQISVGTYPPRNQEYFSDVNLYLIIILGTTSFLFLATIIFLVFLKCNQDRNAAPYYSAICCCRRRHLNDTFKRRGVANESLNYTGTGQIAPNSDAYGYTICLSPESSKSDFLFLKPCHPTLPFNDVKPCQTSNRV
ncbi:protocadherin-10-like [Heterodontus francisci]|uniref:protocadherin-10-like n=1 Tax=Heterodontus francisci TaxID=7792 RepID=UPI00355AD254